MSTTNTTAWLAVALFAVACGGSDAGSAVPEGTPPAGTDPPGTTPPAPTGTATTPPAPAVPCSGKEALAGDLDWKIAAGGDRVVHVHLPKGYDRTRATPVVLNFHGLGSNAAEQNLLSGMTAKGDEVGFITVHAEGTGVSQSWNAGACCGSAASGAVDDVGFVGKIIDELESKLCVDGFLSHRLACEMSTRIAAIAPVAGVLGTATCNPSRPMSVFQFHGTLDGLVPYNGNPSLGFPSVMQALSAWGVRSGCKATARETSKKGEVTCVTFDECKGGAEVNLCTVTGGGHTWPGGVPVPSLGHTTTDINATNAMWDFFVKHPLP
jgi:polyhydroxybutyrate depolymerase